MAERLLQALRDVVDVVGHPAQQITAGLRVDVAEGQAAELVLDVGPQAVHGSLHDAGKRVRLQVREPGGADVESQHRDQHAAQRREVDVLATSDRVEDEVGPVAEDLRPQHRQRHADQCEAHHGDRPGALGAHACQQALGGATEVLRLLGRHAECAHRAGRRCGPRLGWSNDGLVVGWVDGSPIGGVGAHAASSAVICDSTISR